MTEQSNASALDQVESRPSAGPVAHDTHSYSTPILFNLFFLPSNGPRREKFFFPSNDSSIWRKLEFSRVVNHASYKKALSSSDPKIRTLDDGFTVAARALSPLCVSTDPSVNHFCFIEKKKSFGFIRRFFKT